MRPLAVLVLILGAVAALGFAILSITSDSDGSRNSTVAAQGPVSGPATGAPGTPSVLVDPDAPVSPAEPLDTEEERVAVGGAGVGGAWHNQVFGRVVDAEGNPIEGALVELVRGGGPTSSALQALMNEEPVKPTRTQVTKQAGTFVFRALEPGTSWTLVASHDAFTRDFVGPFELPETGEVEELIQLRKGIGMAGVVTDKETGAIIAGASLVLDDPIYTFMPRKGPSPTRQEAISDADGRYTFPNVNPGQRTLTVKAKGYATQIRSSLQIPKSATTQREMDVELEPGLVIAGRVLAPDGSGVGGAVIEAMSYGDLASRGRGISSPDGEFLIEDVAPGTYTLRVEVADFIAEPVPRIEGGDTDVQIHCQALGGVFGVVVDDSTGKPVEEFTITVRQVHPTNNVYGRSALRKGYRNQAKGEFSLHGLKEERYVIQADAPGFASSFSDPFEVEQGAVTPDILVPLTRGGTIRGQLVDAKTGEPVAGALVSTHPNNWIKSPFTELLRGAAQSALSEIKVRSDQDGNFELELLTPEIYQVQVRHPEYTKVVQNDVEALQGETTELGKLKLSRGGTVTGEVYDAKGLAVKRARVYLHPKGGDAFAGGYVEATADGDGRFVLKNVRPGLYTLSASRNRGGSGANPFQDLIDTTNSEVEIEVIEGGEYNWTLNVGEE